MANVPHPSNHDTEPETTGQGGAPPSTGSSPAGSATSSGPVESGKPTGATGPSTGTASSGDPSGGTSDGPAGEGAAAAATGSTGSGAAGSPETSGSGKTGEPGDDRRGDDGRGDDGRGDDELAAAAQAVEVDLAALLAEREQFLDAYRRAQADFENYRKQAQRRQDEAVARELGSFVERLLPVLDACDAAAAQGAADAVEPIVSALFGALEREGLERIDPKGEAFDPTEAEAVVHEPGEGGAQVVAEVLRAGYRWQKRLLRPALVKVTD
jgi:molecular chaperone GrpE